MDGAEDSGREIGLKGRMRFEICGGYRRGKPITKDVDLVMTVSEEDDPMAYKLIMVGLKDRLEVWWRNDSKSCVLSRRWGVSISEEVIPSAIQT